MFPTQSSKPDFNAIYETVHDYWSDNHIFEASIEQRDPDNQFRFYDGPPFITGLPHYGHLASSVAKDVIPRYQTMKGKRVDRVWGRDAHGIPIEQKVQKKLGLESNLDIEKVGIEKFIQECYNYTRSMSSEWKRYVDHFARWVDFDNSYKTMDTDYMESVWRVFKTLWDKGLIYKGKRVSMYSTKLETPISNFEVAMDDSYDDINDPAITVAYDLSVNGKDYDNTSILVWTTTPRTIPANIAVGVSKTLNYVKVSYDGQYYVLAQSRVEDVFKGKEYEILDTFTGEQLVGLSYKPPFNYLYGKTQNPKDYKIYHADFVSDTDGTGIVHQAPEFGEVDFQLAQQVGMTITEAMNASGHYTSLMKSSDDEPFDLAGRFYRDANDDIMTELKDRGVLFNKASITHRVAFCPRTGIPLVYKAQDSWFIDINGPQAIFGGKSLKQRAIEENEKINRYPAHNKHGRFLKNLETAPDWGISRTRFWGTPMPIYAPVGQDNLEFSDYVAVGSREELYKLSQSGSQNIEKREIDGKTIYRNTTRDAELDMHLPYIDDVWFERDGIRYARIPEVLDSWIESASMPYAQVHYPFENKAKFEKSFPADYVVEYTGQIRARFYVMHILGVALFESPAFTNVICHGVIAGDDGRKMSKSFGNFPDPKPTFEQYGGDAIRMAILTTPLFAGGDMSFSEDLIKEALKHNILPLWNAFSFFTTYANIDKWSALSGAHGGHSQSTNLLDQRILGELQEFIQTIDSDLANYDLAHSSRQISLFLDNLTNRYIRRSRRRFWKSESDEDKDSAYQTLYTVLTQFCLAAAPFMPIITEYIWRSLTEMDSSVVPPQVGDDHEQDNISYEDSPHPERGGVGGEGNSVHLQNFPTLSGYDNPMLKEQMDRAKDIISAGLSARSKRSIRVRQPLASLQISVELDSYYLDIIAEELNIKSVTTDTSLKSLVSKIIMPNGANIGKKFGQHTQEIFRLAKSGVFTELENQQIQVGERILEAADYHISYISAEDQDLDDIEVDAGIVMKFDWIITPELELEGYARDTIRAIQDARKEAGYDIADRIQLQLSGDYAAELVKHHKELIENETLSTILEDLKSSDIQKNLQLGDYPLSLQLHK